MRRTPIRRLSSTASEPEQVLRSLEAAYGVSITLHDLHGRLGDPRGQTLLPGRHRHAHPCCDRGRARRADWNRLCQRECFHETERAAGEAGQPFVKRCWKGLLEVVVPINYRNRHQMTFFAGVFRDRREADAELPPWFRAAYHALPRLSPQRAGELARVLRLFGLGLLEAVEERTAKPAGGRLATIRRYIREHATEAVTVAELAAELSLSPSRAGHLVRELAGRSFTAMVEEERLTRARTLLATTDRAMADIAVAVGYGNVYYFHRVFTRAVGRTPGRYRRDAATGRPTPGTA